MSSPKNKKMEQTGATVCKTEKAIRQELKAREITKGEPHVRSQYVSEARWT